MDQKKESKERSINEEQSKEEKTELSKNEADNREPSKKRCHLDGVNLRKRRLLRGQSSRGKARSQRVSEKMSASAQSTSEPQIVKKKPVCMSAAWLLSVRLSVILLF